MNETRLRFHQDQKNEEIFEDNFIESLFIISRNLSGSAKLQSCVG